MTYTLAVPADDAGEVAEDALREAIGAALVQFEDVSERTVATVRSVTDRDALDAIRDLLSDSEWSADTAPAVAELVAATGRAIRDLGEQEYVLIATPFCD